MLERIFLDVNGVLADFAGGCAQIFAKDPESFEWPEGVYDVGEAFGIDEEIAWATISTTPRFFMNLDPCAWAEKLVELCHQFTNRIETLSACHPKSVGAIELRERDIWLQSEFPNFWRHYSPLKEHFVAAGILIDDHEPTVERFVEAGGQAILFPQPWNSNSRFANEEDRLHYVESELDWLLWQSKQQISIDIPLPPKTLHPNNRPRTKKTFSFAKKKYRDEVLGHIKAQIIENGLKFDRSNSWPAAKIELVYTFTHNQKHDPDNLISWAKYAVDGLQRSGLIANDNKVTYLPPVQKKHDSRESLVMNVQGTF